MEESTPRRRLPRNRSGQGLVEYILALSLVGIALILALLAFRDGVGGSLDGVAQSVQSTSATSSYVPGGGSGAMTGAGAGGGTVGGTTGGTTGGSGSNGGGRGGGVGGGRGSGRGPGGL